MPRGIYKRTEETKRKIKEHHKGALGYHHTEETKKKLREINLERKKRLGYLISPEARRKLSIAQKGKPRWTNEQKIEIGRRQKGKKLSEEHKRRLKESAKKG